MLDLRSAPPPVAAAGGAHPEAFSAARWLAREHDIIPSVYHEAVRFPDATGRTLLVLMDGTRTRQELAASMDGAFATGAGTVERAIEIFARKALLVA